MGAEIGGQAQPDSNVYIPGSEMSPSPGGGFLAGILAGAQDAVTNVVEAGNQVAGAAGPGFAYTREQLESLERKWSQLAEDFRADVLLADVIARAEGPGAEYASGGNAEMIRSSGRTLVDTLEQRAEYCDVQAAKIRAALGQYSSAEDDAVGEVKKQGGSL